MFEERIQRTISSFKANGIDCKYFKNTEEAKKYIFSVIKENDTVGFGGSMTLFDMNLHDEILNKGNEVFWHWLVDKPEERRNAILKARDANIYLTSSNAITEEGELVNVDGVGNRVTSMIFGPQKTIVVCGINKLCSNTVEALDRIRKKASPPNSKRLSRKTPCVKTGECHDCNSPDRICNVTTIIHKKPSGIDMELLLINEELGY